MGFGIGLPGGYAPSRGRRTLFCAFRFRWQVGPGVCRAPSLGDKDRMLHRTNYTARSRSVQARFSRRSTLRVSGFEFQVSRFRVSGLGFQDWGSASLPAFFPGRAFALRGFLELRFKFGYAFAQRLHFVWRLRTRLAGSRCSEKALHHVYRGEDR